MSCYWEATRELAEDEPIPIGRPFDNTDIILLDENGKESDEGEISIRGTCVTMGYYNDPEKTAEAFVQNPLNSAYGEIIYRTGDIGKYNAYGELVFLCRRDSQIKHMGHRIELGEIELASLKSENVNQACCVYDYDAKKIVVFYTGSIAELEMRAHLQTLVPRYMLPAAIIKLAAMPLTPNGKIDRKGLRERVKDL
jgi:acyl-CoA synthetase (AMP-forming)/AMP-acid ligase II